MEKQCVLLFSINGKMCGAIYKKQSELGGGGQDSSDCISLWSTSILVFIGEENNPEASKIPSSFVNITFFFHIILTLVYSSK